MLDSYRMRLRTYVRLWAPTLKAMRQQQVVLSSGTGCCAVGSRPARDVADDVVPTAVSQGQSNDTKSLQGAYDDIFMQYQVDFTTYGHIHVYARCVCSGHRRVLPVGRP